MKSKRLETGTTVNAYAGICMEKSSGILIVCHYIHTSLGLSPIQWYLLQNKPA